MIPDECCTKSQPMWTYKRRLLDQQNWFNCFGLWWMGSALFLMFFWLDCRGDSDKNISNMIPDECCTKSQPMWTYKRRLLDQQNWFNCFGLWWMGSALFLVFFWLNCRGDSDKNISNVIPDECLTKAHWAGLDRTIKKKSMWRSIGNTQFLAEVWQKYIQIEA